MRHRKDPAAFERRLQILLVRRFRRYVMPWDAVLAMVANGEYRPAETLDLLDAMGLERGITDLVMVAARGLTCWIEVKLEKTLEHTRTDLTQTQRELHDTWAYMGHVMRVVRSLEELWAIVEEFAIPHRPWPRPVLQEAFDLRRRRRRAV
jgi:hypothetical protein